jgi:hypothetical protein
MSWESAGTRPGSTYARAVVGRVNKTLKIIEKIII